MSYHLNNIHLALVNGYSASFSQKLRQLWYLRKRTPDKSITLLGYTGFRALLNAAKPTRAKQWFLSNRPGVISQSCSGYVGYITLKGKCSSSFVWCVTNENMDQWGKKNNLTVSRWSARLYQSGSRQLITLKQVLRCSFSHTVSRSDPITLWINENQCAMKRNNLPPQEGT